MKREVTHQENRRDCVAPRPRTGWGLKHEMEDKDNAYIEVAPRPRTGWGLKPCRAEGGSSMRPSHPVRGRGGD